MLGERFSSIFPIRFVFYSCCLLPYARENIINISLILSRIVLINLLLLSLYRTRFDFKFSDFEFFKFAAYVLLPDYIFVFKPNEIFLICCA